MTARTFAPTKLRGGWLLATAILLFPCLAAAADGMRSAHRKAAEQYLAALATGEPGSVAYAIHPAELDELRGRLLEQLREEAERGDSVLRSRLFGPGMPLEDIERLTSLDFFAKIGERLTLTGREYEKLRGIAIINASDGNVHVVVEGEQPRERGRTRVIETVTVKPYGSDFKATIQSETRAQIEDLIAGRGPAVAVRTAGAAGGSQLASTPTAIAETLAAAEKALAAGECGVYYNQHMSPNFRRVISKSALESLISTCQRSLGTRQMLLTTLRVVREATPRLEYEGRRAVYDLAGQGFPFERFVLEKVDRDWYIAE